MSTKTLRKRIALVAVSALTAGVLSVASAPIANAMSSTAITAPNIHMVAATGAGQAGAIGQCAISATALAADITTINSTGTVLAVGGTIGFDTTTNGAGNLVITGPAQFTTSISATGTISQDAKTVGFADNINTVAVLAVTGVGDITVTAKNSATIGSGSSVKTFSITGVASCASGSTPVAANSYFQTNDAADGATITTGSLVDETLGADDIDYDSILYINTVLKNQYEANVSTAGVLTAEGTGAVLIGCDTAGLSNIAICSATAATDGNNVDFHVQQNTTLAPNAPLTTTVTIKFNGVTLATKTLKFYGAAASIVVDEVTVGTSGSTGAFKFVVKDSAGNLLDTNVDAIPSALAISGAVAGVTYGGIVSAAVGTGQSVASSGTKATGTFTCAAAGAGTSGSQDIQIGAQVGTALVKSNTFTARCGSSTVDTYTASMDKAVYSPGEIATLTITAKDANGQMVGDTAAVGAAYNQISVPGMTIIGSAISSADVFTSGAKAYKFRVDQAEGSFVAQVGVTATVDLTVKTLQYSIKQSGTVVTNADVLKSIVSLIASINKQIRALQKLILKR